MNEMTDMLPEPDVGKKYTLKVLFGPMFGCELHLPADDYFIIIQPGLALQDNPVASFSATDHAAAYAQNTLYLPCDNASPNLVLCLSTPVDEEGLRPGYRVDVQDEHDSYSALLQENDVFTHQHIRFAIKKSEEEWSDAIKNFTLSPAHHDAEFRDQETLDEFNNKKKHVMMFGTVILAALLLITAIVWYKKMENDRRIVSLNEALAGAPASLEIVRGRDDKFIYVLSTKYQAVEWVREALFKLRENNTVFPVWLTGRKKEIVEQLNKAGFPVLQIDFTQPQYPIIALWKNISPQQIKNLNAAALGKMPFASDIRTTIRTRVQLLQEARQGLDRLHVYYRQINTSSGYALVVRDALSDNALSALQYFINDFDHQWGDRIINFSINLDENWLQNKSYLDASNGYLFLNPRHWYFPIKQGDINV